MDSKTSPVTGRETEILDGLLPGLYPKARAGDTAASSQIIKVIGLRRKLQATPNAPGLHVTCPACGEAHHRCIGHYERAEGPKPCGRVGSNDSDMCWRHGGGSASPARAHARRRAIKDRSKAMTEAIATLNQLGIPIETDPLDALLGQLGESAGIIAIFREHMQQLRIPEAGDDGGPDAIFGPDHTGDAAPHILFNLYSEERERFAKLADMALRAGVQERQVRIIEQQGVLFADLVRRLLDDPTLGLSDDQRQRGRSIAAGHLRALSA